MVASDSVIVALSGGVDSAVAALRLVEQGFAVECLHMTNWEDDDGYCQAAADLHDARRTAEALGLTLHRVNFAAEYYESVFEDFLAAIRCGDTPNPDVMCNRYIKFGVMQQYAQRLGARWLATGHYARTGESCGQPTLNRSLDRNKDQTYFLNSILPGSLDRTLFPLGELEKAQVRRLAGAAALPVAAKRDSTGICFIGERPFADFLQRFVPSNPGPIVTSDGETIGEHKGLAYYTLGQRQGLGIGGRSGRGGEPWYVAAKHVADNRLVVVQDANDPLLFQNWLLAVDCNWIGPAPAGYESGAVLRATARTRYRQPDRPCRFRRAEHGQLEVFFDQPERTVTPGQYVVLYAGDRCLGGARITETGTRRLELAAAV